MPDSKPSTVRQRKAVAPTPDKTVPTEVLKKEDSTSFSLLDIARTVVFLVLVSSVSSYFITGESFVWNVARPQWTKIEHVKAWMAGPKQYTDADLAIYDGTNATLPVLLAINGTIYDVSAGRRHYGPKGAYHFFAGADASRGFVTGCFDEDRNPDLRGVEKMYIPLDDPEVDGLYSAGDLAHLKYNERKKAKAEVYKALKHWVDFFENSPKYPKIGRVKREVGWETKGPVPTLCKKAQEQRPSARARPGEVDGRGGV
ncbi:putative membrane steroid-binding protein 2 [Amylocarpus encephaloides]|uniref:Membrane steroid-binding protein 2 n=1 Tax=Amylocarpus encephaloides TaxID=45428 RepID=A0A9P8C0F7_9HELO|nr:putative membrane steroid-binding protein 2 [Amylocarpus encephaloides]